MKKVKKNLIYLNLDDLQKLYGLDGKLLKKLKKKRKKRKKGQKSIKFDKSRISKRDNIGRKLKSKISLKILIFIILL